jgi:hypothetical protein
VRALVCVALTTCLVGLLPATHSVSATGPEPPVALNDCVSSDNGDPVVTSLNVEPRTLRVRLKPATATVTVTAEDTGGPGPATGLRSVGVAITEGVNPLGRTFPLQPAGGNTWRGTVVVPPGTSLDGRYGLAVTAVDAVAKTFGRSPNYVYVGPEELRALGSDPGLTVVSDRRDQQQPTMVSLGVSATRIDSRGGDRVLRLRARWKDDLAGVRRIEVGAGAVGGTRLHLQRGTHRDGVWTGRITVGRWVGTQTAQLYVKAFDRVGARRVYGHKALRDKGFPSRIAIVARRDDDGPLPSAVSALPAELDVRQGDGRVPVRVRVTDARSGTAAVRAYVTDGSHRSPSAVLRLVSGSAHDGIWEGDVVVPHCSSNTASYQLGVSTRDVRGATRDRPVNERTMAVAAPDHAVALPIVGSVLSWADPARFLLTFAEDVVGVTPQSLEVRRSEFRPVYRAVPVPATWECLDAAGGTVDCSGPLRAVRLTLAEPHVVDSPYQVLVNPAHVLDVRDLAGNTVRRLEVFLGQQAPAT